MKDIGFSRYCITKSGEVYSLFSNRYMKQNKSHNGYSIVNIVGDDGNKKTKKVHRLLLQTFQPIDNPSVMTVNHKDGDKGNNNLSNLEWLSFEDNIRHAHVNDLIAANFSNEHTVYPEDDEVIFLDKSKMISTRKDISEELLHVIFQRLQDGYRICDLSKMVGVRDYTIKNLVNTPNDYISEIAKGYDLTKRFKPNLTSPQTAIKICELLVKGNSSYSIAKDLNVSEATVRKIKERKTHKIIGATYEW